MSASSRLNRRSNRRPHREGGLAQCQRGVAAVEFALGAVVFFTLVFGAIELARMLYVFNTVHEATRYAANAASMISHRDTAGLDRIRQQAIFRTSPGELLLGGPISDSNVRIDYLALVRDASGSLALQPIAPAALPTCPRNNREICMTDPHAANCIRFVRARICADGDDAGCSPAPFRTFVPFVSLPLAVPKAVTLRPTESFGSMPEGTPCL